MNDQTPSKPLRIAIFSRYNLADQYDLAAEFKGMLRELASRNDVLHLSLQGTRQPDSVPDSVEVQEIPVKVDRASNSSVLLQSLRMYWHLPGIARRLKAFNPDIIFLSEILPFVGLFLRWRCKTKVATAYGDWHFHNRWGGRWWAAPILKITEVMDRFEVRRLSGFFCRATAAANRVQRWGIPADLTRVVRDAPDTAEFGPRDETALRESLGFGPDDIVLSYHGVMHQGKGLDLVIRWVDEIYRDDPRIGLLLVGGGPEQDQLVELANSLPAKDRIKFSGWLKTTMEIANYCNVSDICVVMRTNTEANARVVPGALLRSMACRKIVIGPRLDGIAEILTDGENGYMFTPDDGKDFIRLVKELIADPTSWEPVRERAYRDILDKYSVAAAEKLYAEAIEHFARTA